MQDNEKKPALRFKGFTDPWEQRKLAEIANFSKGVGYSKNDLCEEGTPIILYGRLYTKYETSIFDVDTFVKEKAGSVYSKGGEVIVPASGETAEDISIASVVVKPGILLGGDLNVVSPTTEYDSAFLALTISSGAAHEYLSSLAQGKSVVHLHNTDIQSVSAKFPTKREQEKIHLLFGKIDTLITLHQRKYEKLVNIKKSMLDKMFPKNGASVPEIRFKGFTDPWEQRKISELAEKTYGGGTPTTSNEAFWNGNIPWIQSSDIVDGKLMGVEPRKYITQTGLNSSATQLVPKNSIAIITRVGVGKLAYMPFSYSTSQDFLSLSKLNTEPFFTVYACYKKLQSELNTVQGTSIKGITKDELLAKTISVPVYSEQKQIGSFFAQLDTLITLHQRKLEKLQNIKKSCLEKMFV